MLAIKLPPDAWLEDLEDASIALERLERPERLWALDDLERELGLER